MSPGVFIVLWVSSSSGPLCVCCTLPTVPWVWCIILRRLRNMGFFLFLYKQALDTIFDWMIKQIPKQSSFISCWLTLKLAHILDESNRKKGGIQTRGLHNSVLRIMYWCGISTQCIFFWQLMRIGLYSVVIYSLYLFCRS